jgi:glucosamine--fructose-6-phosphate aminotransferase (isomerizing)
MNPQNRRAKPAVQSQPRSVWFNQGIKEKGMVKKTMENSAHTYQEIISQPQTWQSVLNRVQEWSQALSSLWKPEAIQEVIFTGCGSPYYLAQTAAAIFQEMTGKTGRAYPASEILMFPDLTLAGGKNRLLVALSRSGETTELIRAIERFRSLDHGPVIGITCSVGSSLCGWCPDLSSPGKPRRSVSPRPALSHRCYWQFRA